MREYQRLSYNGFVIMKHTFTFTHHCKSSCPKETLFVVTCSFTLLAMHSLAAASRPRLSETEPIWVVFETSCCAFGGESVASQK